MFRRYDYWKHRGSAGQSVCFLVPSSETKDGEARELTQGCVTERQELKNRRSALHYLGCLSSH